MTDITATPHDGTSISLPGNVSAVRSFQKLGFPLITISSPLMLWDTKVVNKMLNNESLRRDRKMKRMILATDRHKLSGEQSGDDYHFFTPIDFARKVSLKKFFSHVEAYKEIPSLFARYGILNEEIERLRAEYKQSAFVCICSMSIRNAEILAQEYGGDDVFSIFLYASYEKIKVELEHYSMDANEDFSRRLETAERELRFQGYFSRSVSTENWDKAYAQIEEIIRTFQCNI